MQGTRERMLEYLVANREARAEEMAAHAGITKAAVRRHLDNLRADGLVEIRVVRQAIGRPYYVYFPTEKATRTVPPAYAGLLERMLEGVGTRPEIGDVVVASVAEALAARHRGEVDAASAVGEAVERVTMVLRGEGILEAWRSEDDGFHLVNTSCPYHRAAIISSLPCESDRRAIELLLGQDVEQLNRIVDGAPCCEYLVRDPAQPQIIEVR